MDSNEVILNNLARVFVVELKDANRSQPSNFLLICDRAAHNIIDGFELQEVIDLFVVGILSGENVANKCLLSQRQDLIPRRRCLRFHQVCIVALAFKGKVIDEADGVALQGVSRYTHIDREAHDLFFLDDVV